MFNRYNHVFLSLFYYFFVRREGGGPKGITYYTIRMGTLDVKNQEGKETGGRQGQKQKLVILIIHTF